MLADVPHLLKSIRNALYNNKELTIAEEFVQEAELPSNKVYWAAIEAVVEFQENMDWPLAPHLKKEYIKLTSFSKMNVPPAKAVLSKETAEAINILVNKYGKPREWLTTAYFCTCVSDWYDIMNNRKVSIAFSYKNMEAHEEFTSYLKFFMRFFSSMKLHPNQKGGLKPSQKGVLLSTSSVLYLQMVLLDEGYVFVLTARFSNDCIENIFSVVRLKGKLPTCLLFKWILRCVSLCQFMRKVKGSSYDDDDHVSFLADLKSLKEYHQELQVVITEESEEISVTTPVTIRELSELEEDDTFFETWQNDFDPSEGSFIYFCGYILKKTILKKQGCKECIGQWITTKIDWKNENYTFINLREYKEGALTRPSQKAIDIFTIAEKVFREHINGLKNTENVASKLTDRALLIIEDTYSTVKKCHLKTIMSRFLRARLHFFARRETKREVPKNKTNIQSASNSSYSTAAKAALK